MTGLPRLPLNDDALYEQYLEHCRQAGIEPVSRERADEIFRNWNRGLNAAEREAEGLPPLQ